MKWFDIIKDFKYSHGRLADRDLQGRGGYQGVPKEAGGFSHGEVASINLSANAWTNMLYDKDGNYKQENEERVIREMSNTLGHEYGHVLFKKLSGYTGVESETGQVLSNIMIGLILGIDDKEVFDIGKEVDALEVACKRNASMIIIDELYAGYAGKNVDGISRLIIDRYKDLWSRDFNNTLEIIRRRVKKNVLNAMKETGHFASFEALILNERLPFAEEQLDGIIRLMQRVWSNAVDFIYGHFVTVQQKRYYLGTLPENDDTTVGMMTSLISRYLEKAGYDDIQRYISGGELDNKVLEEIGFQRNDNR